MRCKVRDRSITAAKAHNCLLVMVVAVAVTVEVGLAKKLSEVYKEEKGLRILTKREVDCMKTEVEVEAKAEIDIKSVAL